MEKSIRQCFELTFNPSPDETASLVPLHIIFKVLHNLQSTGIYRSAETLRYEVVSYLIKNPSFGGTNFISDILDMGWEDYLGWENYHFT